MASSSDDSELSPRPSSGAPGFAQELGARVAAFSARDLGDEAVHWARVGLLDTLGVTLAGAREPCTRIAEAAADVTDGPALVFGTRRRVRALDAALVNGTAAHALDFDDCNNTMGGHPSAPVIPALWALAEERGASGLDFVTAYVAGFELECKLASAVNFHHYQKGWHPTATLGVFGAAAACARLMALDAQQTATALAIAASFSSGLKSNFGTMTKPLHVGHAARNGLFAARLAQRGFTASPSDVFEHAQGFLDVFNGPGTYDTQRALAAWAMPLDIVRPGIAIKQYPCCGSTHPAIDAMLQLVREHALKAADVERVDAWIHARRLQHTNRPQPRSPLDCKFSLQYVLARALHDGNVAIAHFEGAPQDDATITALLPRIHVAPYGEELFPADNHFGGAVRVTLRDGRVLRAQVDQPLGRTSQHPLPVPLLEEKFALCAERVLLPGAVQGVLAQVRRIEQLAELAPLSRLLAEVREE